jgi:hypothetical protein
VNYIRIILNNSKMKKLKEQGKRQHYRINSKIKKVEVHLQVDRNSSQVWLLLSLRKRRREVVVNDELIISN